MHRLTLSVLIACSTALGACDGRRERGGSSDSTPQPPKPDSGRATEIERAPRADPTVPPGKPPLQAADPYHPAPLDTVDATLYTGWKYYNHDCARCHGQDATGSTIAPYLVESFRGGRVDSAEFWRVMRGSRAANGMPAFVGSMDEDKLGAIYAYLKGRGQGKIHPGRPATR